jgi:acyl-CoA reductase-like NAD-dependent aldehyde dehydrogenase
LNLNDRPAAPARLGHSLEPKFEAQKAAYAREPHPAAEVRLARLAALGRMIRGHERELAAAISADFGNRSAHETRLLEVFPSLEAIGHARRHLRAWMRPRRRATSLWFLPGGSRLVPQPLGVVGIVVPWNYPLLLAVGPMVAALAAGNRILVKMSETTPATGALFERLVAGAFPQGEVVVVNGGPDVAQAFCRLSFDHLLFTGSTPVGRHVMRAAAENLVPVTLELGGKSPAIVGRGFSVAEAAGRILYGKCLNAGQTCVAPDYALVPRESVEDFTRHAGETVRSLYPTLAANPDYTAIVDERHRKRLRALVEEAVRAGAKVVPLGPAGEKPEDEGRMAPAILLDVTPDMAVMREEIFGPVLPVIAYGTLEEAIDFVNARPRPLALYFFEHERAAIDRVLAQTVSGGVTINDTILHIAQDDLPFGGVGPSGMGRYHGREGFETFSHLKSVFHQSRLNGLPLFRPPYGKRFETLVKLLLR